MIKELESFVASFLGSIVTGWSSKVVASLTDTIVSAISQIAWRSGWVVVIVVIAWLIRSAYDDYKGYVAMGVFAVPAIITFFLSWEAASILMGLSVAGLLYMGKDTVLKRFRF
jgi:hypothetical protein